MFLTWNCNDGILLNILHPHTFANITNIHIYIERERKREKRKFINYTSDIIEIVNCTLGQDITIFVI